ncbi:MAG: antitoxin family protein [Gemmataceae bacterium]
MTQTLTAIYERGVLRPTVPLALPEGVAVRVTLDVAADDPAGDAAAAARRQEAAAFVQSLIDAKGRDELPEGYDFLDALNANRGPSEPPLFPPEQKGATW